MAANKTATIKSLLTTMVHLSYSKLGQADGGHVRPVLTSTVEMTVMT